jgi:glutamate dehydrogenase/leucine dehydrogenase
MNEDSKWKGKVQGFLNVCQEEIVKTTEIGKKMLSASKTNSILKDHYEEIGKIVVKELKAGRLEWEHPRVNELSREIEKCKQELQKMEADVQKIKKPN